MPEFYAHFQSLNMITEVAYDQRINGDDRTRCEENILGNLEELSSSA